MEFVDADEVVESSGSSTVSHVCKVASGANETLRFAWHKSVARNKSMQGKKRMVLWHVKRHLVTYPKISSAHLYELVTLDALSPPPPLVVPPLYVQQSLFDLEQGEKSETQHL